MIPIKRAQVCEGWELADLLLFGVLPHIRPYLGRLTANLFNPDPPGFPYFGKGGSRRGEGG